MPYPKNMRWRASKEIQQRAQALRKEMTAAEKILWNRMRGNAIDGNHFRRQHALGPYILDFYCAKSKLAIEVDGGVHDGNEIDDSERSQWFMNEKGIRVLRFKNIEVMNHLEHVIENIRAALLA